MNNDVSRPGRTGFLSTTEATTWDQGVIAGSGRVGVVVHGGPSEHVLSLAHERFFLPANPRPLAPDLAGPVAEARRLLFAGEPVSAARLIDDAVHAQGLDELVWTDPLAPSSVLRWTPDQSDGATDYRREVDFPTGRVTLSWRLASGARESLRVTAPHDGESIILELESGNAVRGTLSLSVSTESQPNGDTASPVDYAGHVSVAAVATGAGGVLTVSAPGVEPGTAARVDTHLRVEGAVAATASEAGLEVRVNAGHSVRAVLELRVDGRAIAAEGLSGEHERLVTASGLDLRSGIPAELTTEELWQRARDGDADALLGTIELAYAAGRHNAISGTGELPPTLQGVWQGTWTPAWSADYTMNGNVQNGGIASLIPTGTPELVRSLLDLTLPYLDDYRDNARLVFGLPGAVLPSRMTTHGKMNHFSAEYPHQFWVGSGGWLLRFVADTILTTGDASMLDDEVWHLTLEVLEFYAALAHQGLAPAYSPENTPLGHPTALSADTTMDVAVIRDAARVGLLFASIRGDHSHDDAWRALAQNAPAFRVADDGTLAEWIAPGYPENVAHRHVSQLYPLWYDVDPAFVDPALRAAARATIEAKIAWRAADPTPPPGRMEMAFGLVQLGLAASALGLADSALHCVTWLARDHWTPAMVSTHDAGRIFNLDASGGLPAVIAAMLVGSSQHELRLLPALPAQWPSGSVTGLRARGGLAVDLDWEPGGFAARIDAVSGSGWLRPDEGTLVRLPRSANLVAGNAVALDDGTFQLGETPTVLRFTWSDFPSPQLSDKLG